MMAATKPETMPIGNTKFAANRRNGKRKRSRAASSDTEKERVSKIEKKEGISLEELLEQALKGSSDRKGTLSDWLNPQHETFWEDLKNGWKKIPKAKRKRFVALDQQKCKDSHDQRDYPFQTEPEDHCESPPEAFSDIAPVLQYLAADLGKSRKDLKIYDPYFCDGKVISHLGSLGFQSVYNRNQDFYTAIVPDHDVVVTNPPYSGDHIEKLLAFVRKNGKPAILLMPNFVCQKPFFRAHDFTFWIPPSRYVYYIPKGFRKNDGKHNHVSSLGVRNSPFISFWFLFKVTAPSQILSNRKRRMLHCKSCSEIPANLLP